MLIDMDVKSPTSSYACCYEDGVFDDHKVEAQYDNYEQQAVSNNDDEQPSPKLPRAALACLALLFIFSFTSIITSGIAFSHEVASSNCFAQSWVMFSVRTLLCCTDLYIHTLISIFITTTLTLHTHAGLTTNHWG